MAASLALLAAVGWIGYRMISQPIPPAPTVAEAEVISAEAHILVAPDSRAKPVIPQLRKGDRVNVLRLPRLREEEWVKVQYVGAKGHSPPGYVQAAALDHWSSEKPDAALALLKLFGPGEAATEVGIREQLQKLTAFLDRFGATEQGPEANLQLARLNLAMARLGQSQGKPSTNWQPHLARAAGQLMVAGTNQGLSSQVEQARRELETLQQPQRPPTRRIGVQQLESQEAIRMAEEAGQEARYNDALRLLGRVLRDNPNHQAARSLYDKVLRAKSKDLGAR